MSEELWKEIPNFTNYCASTHGRIKNKKDKIISQQPSYGYLRVGINNDSGKRITIYVHILIASTFISNIDNKPTVNHKNHNKTDNNINNLEWATILEQNHHKKPIPKEILSKGQNKEIWRIDGKTGKKIEKYNSIVEASKWLLDNNYTKSNYSNKGCPNLARVANKKPKYESAFGFKWEWDDEKENLYKDEIWKFINPNFINGSQNYQVSNYGRIKTSRNRLSVGHKPDNQGYIYIRIQDKTYAIHRLVAYMFVHNNDTNNKVVVHHKDDNPSNNHMSNLEWTTASQNTQYSVDEGKLSKCKKKIIQYDLQGNKLNEFNSITEASNKLNLRRSAISGVLSGSQKTTGGGYNRSKGFKFRYAE